jgi:hypothetical protein
VAADPAFKANAAESQNLKFFLPPIPHKLSSGQFSLSPLKFTRDGGRGVMVSPIPMTVWARSPEIFY